MLGDPTAGLIRRAEGHARVGLVGLDHAHDLSRIHRRKWHPDPVHGMSDRDVAALRRGIDAGHVVHLRQTRRLSGVQLDDDPLRSAQQRRGDPGSCGQVHAPVGGDLGRLDHGDIDRPDESELDPLRDVGEVHVQVLNRARVDGVAQRFAGLERGSPLHRVGFPERVVARPRRRPADDPNPKRLPLRVQTLGTLGKGDRDRLGRTRRRESREAQHRPVRNEFRGFFREEDRKRRVAHGQNPRAHAPLPPRCPGRAPVQGRSTRAYGPTCGLPSQQMGSGPILRTSARRMREQYRTGCDRSAGILVVGRATVGVCDHRWPRRCTACSSVWAVLGQWASRPGG